MTQSLENKRLEEILEMITAMAALDFSKRIDVKVHPDDPLEAIAYGVNMLSEELQNNVIERRRLSDINRHLEDFAYTTSHDLKSPLHAVQGLVTILKNELEESEEVSPEISRLLEMISASVLKMREMIDGILEYSRLDTQSYPVSWMDAEKELKEIIELHAKQNVKIILDTPMPALWFNRIVFIQIMDNLINNSMKYCKKNLCEIHIAHHSEGGEHSFSVSDNGPGIDPVFHAKIFELFVSLPHQEGMESTGIGLATVKKLVESTGGKIRLESAPGKGATFYFTIPVSLPG